MTNYAERLNCSLLGTDDYPLFTLRSKEDIAIGYNRIVIGERGPYVEFYGYQLNAANMYIPDAARWRFTSARGFYREYRTCQDEIKIYHQIRRVDYADYVEDMWYISPFELCDLTGLPLIEKLR